MAPDIIELLSSDEEETTEQIEVIPDVITQKDHQTNQQKSTSKSKLPVDIPSSPWRMNAPIMDDVIQIDDDTDELEDHITAIRTSQARPTVIPDSDLLSISSPTRPMTSKQSKTTKTTTKEASRRSGGKSPSLVFSLDDWTENFNEGALGIHALSKSLRSRTESGNSGSSKTAKKVMAFSADGNTFDRLFEERMQRARNEHYNPSISSSSDAAAAPGAGLSSSPLPEIPKVRETAKVQTAKIQKPSSSLPSRSKDPLKAARKLLEKRQREEKRLADKRLQEVNRRTVPRAERVKEIILVLNETIDASPIAKDLRQELATNNIEVKVSQTSPLLKVINFQKRVTSIYDEEKDLFVPIPLIIEDINQVVIFAEAEDLYKLLTDNEAVDSHASQLKSDFPDKAIIYMIQGLQKYLKKLATSRNRDLVKQVRQQLESDGGNSQAPPNSSQQTESSSVATADASAFYLLLSRLQIFHDIKVVHASNAKEFYEWIVNFSMDIACLPYQQARQNHDDAFDAGYVKSGGNAKEATQRSLEMVKYVTPTSAGAVVEVYPTLCSLMQSISKRGPRALTGIVSNGTKKQILRNSLCSEISRLFSSKNPSEMVFES